MSTHRFVQVVSAATIVAAMVLPAQPAVAQRRLLVVATVAALSSIAAEVGGQRVETLAIAHPSQDPHFIDPKPSDIVKLTRADLFLHGGLDLELWRGPLIEAARTVRFFPGGDREVNCAQNVPLLEVPTAPVSRAAGDIHIFGNPHYWLDPENGKIIARTVLDALVRVDPAGRAAYEANYQRFVTQVDAKMAEWSAKLSPYAGSSLVAYHNSWPYFARRFSLRIDTFLEPKPGIPPSGAHVARVLEQMKASPWKVILVEPYNPRRVAEVTAKRVGGRVVELVSNPGPPAPTGSYLGMFDYNVGVLVDAFTKGSAPQGSFPMLRVAGGP